jgi:putative glutamine amidotransferase
VTSTPHTIHVQEGSALASLLGPRATPDIAVNSRHHQSVGTLGGRFVASAVAADGVIEAIEAPDARFCVGVQWHPENFWQTGEFRGLFDAFVAAARERTERR